MSKFQHFIYPLDLRPESTWLATLETIDGKRTFQFKQKNLTKKNLYGQIFAEWGLSKDFTTVSLGDFIWIYAGWNVKRVLAVGRVERLPESTDGNPKYKGYSHSHVVLVRIDNELTLRLQKEESHITYEQFKQWVPGAIRKANLNTTKVFDRWLKQKPTNHKKNDDEVFQIRREVLQRTGQTKFRETIRSAYNDICAISGTTEPTALVAAHIQPVKSKGRHSVNNGMLLRADIHNMFDSGLISVDGKYRIHISSLVSDQRYVKLKGRKLHLPHDRKRWPSSQVLKQHFEQIFRK
jgi:hypothetical protein